MPGDDPRIGQFAVALLSVTDRKSLDRRFTNLSHQGGYCAGIHAPTQENAERNVAHQAHADDIFEPAAALGQ